MEVVLIRSTIGILVERYFSKKEIDIVVQGNFIRREIGFLVEIFLLM